LSISSFLKSKISKVKLTDLLFRLNEEKKKLAEEGKEILRRKLKQLKINLNESSINELVRFFKLKTSLDLFYRVGINTIDNPMLKKYAGSRSNVLMSFLKNSIRRKRSYRPVKVNPETKGKRKTSSISYKRKKNTY